MPFPHASRPEDVEGAQRREGSIPLLQLPEELQLAVLAPLSAKDLAAALASCKALHSLAPAACLAACHHQSPAWAAAARADDAQAAAAAAAAAAGGGSDGGGAGDGTSVPWHKQLEWMRIREAEEQARAFWSAASIRTLQADVNEGMRAVLVEWLVALSLAWDLDSPVVFKAVQYLDHIMSRRDVGSRTRFQLLGSACLRLAMVHAACRPDQLDAVLFARMAAGAFTADEMQAQTVAIQVEIPGQLTASHSSRHHLRPLWRRLVAAAPPDHGDDMMYAYSLACFLLHLSLLSLDCCDYPPTLLACCALSASLAFFGQPAWPQALVRVFGYKQHQLAPGIKQLLHLQAALPVNVAGRDLRMNWERACTQDAQDAQGNAAQWQRVVQLVRAPSRMQLGGGA